MSLIPRPPTIPRTALGLEERSSAYSAGRVLLRQAAVATHRWPLYAAGPGVPSQATRSIVLERIRLDAQMAARGFGDRLLSGSLSRADWQRKLRSELAARHHAAAMAALGQTTLDARTRAEVDAIIRRQLGFLTRFRADVALGITPLDGRILTRSDLYGAAVWSTGQAIRRDQSEREGFIEERALRHVRDSCATCIRREAQGWQPIGTLVPIGAGICRTRCQCSWEFRGE